MSARTEFVAADAVNELARLSGLYDEQVRRNLEQSATNLDLTRAVLRLELQLRAVQTRLTKVEEHMHSLGSLTGIIISVGDGGMILETSLPRGHVPCVLPAEFLEQARALIGQRVSVAGRIVRGANLLPVSMPEVWNIAPAPHSAPGSYKQAAGIIPWQEGDEPAEVAIRRGRDEDAG